MSSRQICDIMLITKLTRNKNHNLPWFSYKDYLKIKVILIARISHFFSDFNFYIKYMSEEPYTPYIQEREEMILRDYLAVDRTMLANEASFMSYVRTALTLIAAGATLIKFFDNNPAFQVLGWGFVIAGGWLVLHGYNRFSKVNDVLHRIKGEYMEQADKLKNSKGWVGAAIRAVHRL